MVEIFGKVEFYEFKFVEGLYKNGESEKKRLIKRVIGVPGDKIDLKDGKVYLNGQLYNEPYVKGNTLPRSIKFPITISERQYFVHSDNNH